MEQSKTKIVIIDDDVALQKLPLVIKLKEQYENVYFFSKSTEGLKYITDNLSEKTIVLLDINLGTEEPDGHRILTEIREKSKLICVIIFTAISEAQHHEFSDFINNHAYAFLKKSDDYTKVIATINDAENHLNSQPDNALEEWINAHPEADRNKPFFTSKDGKVYTLNQVLNEIRKQTAIGSKIEKDLLMLTIDLIVRGKKKLND